MAVDLCSYLPEQILPMLDRATMAASLEGRVPFVDGPLVEYCMSLSSRTKLGLAPAAEATARRAVAEWMPQEIVHGKKAGMPSPFRRSSSGGRRHTAARARPGCVFPIAAPSSVARGTARRKEDMRRHAPVLYALVIFEICTACSSSNEDMTGRP